MAKKVVDKPKQPKFEVGETIKFNFHHPLYAGQSAVITQYTGGGNFIVKLESGEHVRAPDWHLSPIHTSKEYLSLEEIAIDGGTQSRACLNDMTVEDYAESMDGGAEFPPVLVFYDGSSYWLADGFHRLAAAKKLEWGGIKAEIRQGTRRDAVLYSVGANATHGLRRTNADKRRAVMLLLGDEEWSQWSNREIARAAAVAESLVRKMKEELSAHCAQIDVDYAKKCGSTVAQLEIVQEKLQNNEARGSTVERNGKTYTMDTTKIGQSDRSLETSGSRGPKLDNGQKLLDIQEPKSNKQLLPSMERNPDVPPGEVPPTPAFVVNVSALAHGKPDSVVTEISIGIRHLSPEELAQVLENAANTLTFEHWKAISQVVERHMSEYFKEESA